MNIYSIFVIPGALFLGTILFGIWLGVSGKPYSTALFNIHKLIALATVVFAIIKLLPYLKGNTPSSMIITMMVLAGLSIIALFATGAMMSIIQEPPAIIFWIHRISTILMLGGSITLLYQLNLV
ncbi:MAG: hypothetical protein JEZ00_16755 [Anaerolineaceae bacterium]|nr:hypothetical protein [Anaerolineaceae bacterium]